MSRG
ncbi:hypothetical protein VCHC80A1_03144, partial [Vibrio cholerae HC-80A1]|jgi:hypothetical protein|eukprot:gene26034-biopygen17915